LTLFTTGAAKMKNSLLLASILSLFIYSTAFADKPEWAGKDKSKSAADSMEQLEDELDKKHKHKDKKANKAKHDLDDDIDDMKKDKVKKAKKDKALDDLDSEDKLKGLEKQRDKKASQERKELGKGSEQGQASREENSKKWWKFWGDE